MPKPGLVFLDLDDNIFRSKRKSQGDNLVPVAFRPDGEPAGFMDERQHAFFHWLMNSGVRIVPTTARNSELFSMVRLPLGGEYAILAHGAVIRKPDGDIDQQWHQRISAGAQNVQRKWWDIRHLLMHLAERKQFDVTATLVHDADLDLYLQFKHNKKDATQLEEFASYARVAVRTDCGWQVLLNDNNLSILPPYLGKEKAVAYLCEKLADEVSFVIGSGDSLSDVPFMSNCAYALMPTNSQVFGHLNKGG